MAKIFISYSRKNREIMKQVVDELVEVFIAEGIFYDKHNAGGEPWWDNILKQIGEASVFVYLVSNDSLASYACRAEYLEAMRLGKHIVPVDITDDVDLSYTDPPLAFVLRKVHRLKHRRMNAVIRTIAEGLIYSNATSYREKIQSFDMNDVAGEHVNIGGVTTYNITYVMQGDAPIREPAAGSAPAPLPPPFAWIDIPAGKVTLILDDFNGNNGYLKQETTFDVPAFAIAKYPTTNAQFAKFVEAGGYRERKWWTADGWKAREEGWSNDDDWKPSGTPWTEPDYWNDGKWNGAEQPVVGVSWYETSAYCQWLSEQTGQKITLPTEQQWQRAAQGDDGREYPWGDGFDSDRCNTGESGSRQTTPVTRYQGKGDSPFGVSDMAGNVWEWCLTQYVSGHNNTASTASRVLRGGSWSFDHNVARAVFRVYDSPGNRFSSLGFRLCRAPSL